MKTSVSIIGVGIELNQHEKQLIADHAKKLNITPRQFLESYTGMLGANFYEDIKDLAATIDTTQVMSVDGNDI